MKPTTANYGLVEVQADAGSGNLAGALLVKEARERVRSANDREQIRAPEAQVADTGPPGSVRGIYTRA